MGEGDGVRARSLYEESLAVGTEQESPWPLRMLGFVALGEGDLSAARRYFLDSIERYRRLEVPLGQVECLNGFARLALEQANLEKAGRILGAVAALLRKLVGGTLHGQDRREYERSLAVARAALDDRGFAAAWAAGQAMTLDQAVAYALEPEGG